MRFEVVQGDATAIEGDVLALKYAQAPYGLDAHVGKLLAAAEIPEETRTPRPGGFRLYASPPGLAARHVLIVGVEDLWNFGYEQIRLFSRKVLTSLAGELPDARRLLVTLHGPGYGLDESEAFESELAGFLDAMETSDVPEALEVITFVERNKGRADRLAQILPGLVGEAEVEVGKPLAQLAKPAARDRLRSVGFASGTKPHVFVAMPFSDETDDLYHYGISRAVERFGLLCERADSKAFTGDVIEWVTTRIRSAALVVAELTGANPNVYLEVGYAWGCDVPTILLASDASELKFDVRGQRTLVYGKKIMDLEEKLFAELRELLSGEPRPR